MHVHPLVRFTLQPGCSSHTICVLCLVTQAVVTAGTDHQGVVAVTLPPAHQLVVYAEPIAVLGPLSKNVLLLKQTWVASLTAHDTSQHILGTTCILDITSLSGQLHLGSATTVWTAGAANQPALRGIYGSSFVYMLVCFSDGLFAQVSGSICPDPSQGQVVALYGFANVTV